MSYYKPDEMMEVLEHYPEFREKLYCRGFLITTERQAAGDGYPFYSNWAETAVNNQSGRIVVYLYTHKDTYKYTYTDKETTLFLIGHAYDPYHMITDEMQILERLAKALRESTDRFWDAESDLTGAFCIGYISENELIYTTDSTGMQLIYHGIVDGNLYITSHSKLVADLKDLEQPEYIKRLINNHFWRYKGTSLPGDLSPYEALKRVNPNSAGRYVVGSQKTEHFRFFPTEKLSLIQTEEQYRDVIRECRRVMENTMACIAQKWPEKKVSISVTGGRDSLTTLACSNQVYDRFSYFSFISNYDESVDAYAARDILAHLGLKHELYEIPETWEDSDELQAFKRVMECNNGCIGANNANDLRKRLYFSKRPPCDIEVKSLINEIGRGGYFPYSKLKFPKYPYASYWRVMHKVYLNPYLIRETDRVFARYLQEYYSKEVFDKIPWEVLNYWEFTHSSGDGMFMTSEHRVTCDITFPFNNRKYLMAMLTVPYEKRKLDAIPIDIIAMAEPRISETGIHVNDVSHTNFLAFAIRMYIRIFSKIRFGGKKEKY